MTRKPSKHCMRWVHWAAVSTSLILISSVKKQTNMYIYFLAHEVMSTQREMHMSKLGRCDSDGDCDLCMSTVVTTRHIRLKYVQIGKAWLWWWLWPLYEYGCNYKTHQVKLVTCSPWLVDLATPVCNVDQRFSRRDSSLPFCGYWFNLQWVKSQYTLLMRPN